MKSMELYSEPFATTGNITGEGFRRLLGRPTLGLLQTVIREALQNSMDATLPGQGPKVMLRSRVLRGEEFAALRRHVFAEIPKDADAALLQEELMGKASRSSRSLISGQAGFRDQPERTLWRMGRKIRIS